MNLSPGVVVLLIVFAGLAVFRSAQLQRLLATLTGSVTAGMGTIAGRLDKAATVVSGLLGRAVAHSGSEQCTSLTHQLIGLLLFAICALGVLAGDAALMAETVCGMVGDACASGLPMVNPAIALGLSLLASAAFTAMVVADLDGLTQWRKWPSSRGFKWLAHGAFLFSLALLVMVAAYREQMIASVPSTPEELLAFLQQTSPLRKSILLGGGLLIAAVSTTALVAVGSLLEVVVAAVLAIPAIVVLRLLAMTAKFASWAAVVINRILHDLIALVSRHGTPPSAQPRAQETAEAADEDGDEDEDEEQEVDDDDDSDSPPISLSGRRRFSVA